MKLTIPRPALLAALAAVHRVVERRTSIPILSNVALHARDGRLTVRGTDLDIEARASVEAAIERPGAVTAPAATLHDIVRKLPDGPVSLDLGDDSRLVVKAGRSRFVLSTLPETEFPTLDVGDMSHRFALSGRALARLIAKSEFAISTEETRYYLNGIFFHTVDVGGSQKLRAVATDGHRLARIDTPAPEGAQGMPGIIVPRKTVGEIARMAAAAPDAEITLAVSATKIQVASGEQVLTSKLIDGTFPDYGRVIPAGNDQRLTFDGAAMRSAIDLVTTLSSERGRAVKMDIGPALCRLTVTDPDRGESTAEVDVTRDGAGQHDVHIGFNGSYAGTILSALDAEHVALAIGDVGGPTLWERAGDHDGEADSALYVLMPMRV